MEQISIQRLRKGSLRSTDSQAILGTRHTLADVDTPPSHDDAKSMSRVAAFVSFLLMKAATAGMKIRWPNQPVELAGKRAVLEFL